MYCLQYMHYLDYLEFTLFTVAGLTVGSMFNAGFVFQPVVKVLSPQGYKSLMLSREVEKGPALMLFTPHKPHAHFNSFYNMVGILMDFYIAERISSY